MISYIHLSVADYVEILNRTVYIPYAKLLWKEWCYSALSHDCEPSNSYSALTLKSLSFQPLPKPAGKGFPYSNDSSAQFARRGWFIPHTWTDNNKWEGVDRLLFGTKWMENSYLCCKLCRGLNKHYLWSNCIRLFPTTSETITFEMCHLLNGLTSSARRIQFTLRSRHSLPAFISRIQEALDYKRIGNDKLIWRTRGSRTMRRIWIPTQVVNSCACCRKWSFRLVAREMQ